jgi:ABC-type Fe3+ transport system permease subunit
MLYSYRGARPRWEPCFPTIHEPYKILLSDQLDKVLTVKRYVIRVLRCVALCVLFYALCYVLESYVLYAMLCACYVTYCLCSMLYALYALCSVYNSMLVSMLYALCSMLYALVIAILVRDNNVRMPVIAVAITMMP